MKEETAEHLEELRLAVARQLGADPAELVVMVSRPGEPPAPMTVCTRCWERYPDESGCDPCPFCGASYFQQIFPGLNRRPRLLRLKGRRREARRRRARGRSL